MTIESALSRRDLMGLAAAASLLGSTAATAAESPWTEVESSHIDIATRFCKAWETRDIERILEPLADDIVYQMFDNAPLTRGKEAMRTQLAPFVGRMREIRWEIFRSHAIGPVVINDRVDYFLAPEGGKDMIFPVVGVFWIVAGKIKLWYDYNLPKTRVVTSPA